MEIILLALLFNFQFYSQTQKFVSSVALVVVQICIEISIVHLISMFRLKLQVPLLLKVIEVKKTLMQTKAEMHYLHQIILHLLHQLDKLLKSMLEQLLLILLRPLLFMTTLPIFNRSKVNCLSLNFILVDI